ncbi:MAG: protein kinase [Deltaproteobacteria bacterium]|nr:protein kinase [Deltaproteobacteria bacterium]
MGALSPAPPKNPGPVRFGRYELVQRIGAGGMGEVWLARLPGLGGIHKVCVVKKILPHLSSDPSFVRRFLDEAKVVVHLSHGNIAQVYEMGEEDGEYFMAMEYVEGKTISRISTRLREREERFPLPLALYIGARACDALAYAHRKTDPSGRPLHVVHRDISPANILVSYEGEVKIIDFGAALSTLKEAHTAPRVIIGNLAYMSPEQARKRPVDGRADVYSISVVLWELIAWRPLPTGGDHVERWRRAAFPHFAPPSKLQSDVPSFLDAIIMRGLAQDPAERYPNAEALRDELQRALTQLAAKTSQTTLNTLMATVFRKEAVQDRGLIARALADYDPDTTERSARHAAHVLEHDEVTGPAGDHIAAAVAQVLRAGPPPPLGTDSLPRAQPQKPGPPVSDESEEASAPRASSGPAELSQQSEVSEPSLSSPTVRKPPPPVDDQPEKHVRGTDELPTITWAQPAVRRRRLTDTGTSDYSRQTPRRMLLRGLLFAGAFVTGVGLAVLVYQFLTAPPQPESLPSRPVPTVRAPSPR